jgi:hypothetical protein
MSNPFTRVKFNVARSSMRHREDAFCSLAFRSRSWLEAGPGSLSLSLSLSLCISSLCAPFAPLITRGRAYIYQTSRNERARLSVCGLIFGRVENGISLMQTFSIPPLFPHRQFPSAIRSKNFRERNSINIPASGRLCSPARIRPLASPPLLKFIARAPSL